jgi:hypothetical protein
MPIGKPIRRLAAGGDPGVVITSTMTCRSIQDVDRTVGILLACGAVP